MFWYQEYYYRSSRVFVFNPGGNTFRHTANNKIIAAGFHQTPVEDFFNLLIFINAAIVSIQCRINGFKKLVKG